ncbi:MAG: Omp28-related outer membrane protein [Flavobacteriales bacterium]|nr:Omp28-related outer membrane protein [Flavobacteriales bacterium]
MMKTNRFLALALIFFGFNAIAQDGYLSNLTINKYLKTSTNYTLTAKLKNTTNTSITTCEVKWQLDNGAINSKTINIGGGGVVSSNYMPVTLTPDLSLSSTGNYELKVWVETLGDIDNTNDTITKNLIGLSSYADNKVLIEKYTATWCQYCPAGSIVFNTLASNPDIVLASFHNSDAYSFTDGENYMEAYYPGGIFTPGGIINMGEMGDYEINSQHPGWEDEVTGRIGISPVDLQLTTNIDTITRTLTVDITANFKYAFSGDFYLNAYILENNISGTQTNGGSPYSHQHVVREMLGGSIGISGIIPALPVVNTDYFYQNISTIPSAWNINEIEVVAYVFEKNLNKTNTLNAASVELFPTGIDDALTASNSVHIYPNPVTDHLNLHSDRPIYNTYELKIYDIAGKLVLAGESVNFQNQKVNVSALKGGIYFVHLANSDKETYKFKMIKK